MYSMSIVAYHLKYLELHQKEIVWHHTWEQKVARTLCKTLIQLPVIEQVSQRDPSSILAMPLPTRLVPVWKHFRTQNRYSERSAETDRATVRFSSLSNSIFLARRWTETERATASIYHPSTPSGVDHFSSFAKCLCQIHPICCCGSS